MFAAVPVCAFPADLRAAGLMMSVLKRGVWVGKGPGTIQHAVKCEAMTVSRK